VQIPVDSFESFQADLREISAGKLKAEVMESKEAIFKIEASND
jgi:hypothetical protein